MRKLILFVLLIVGLGIAQPGYWGPGIWADFLQGKDTTALFNAKTLQGKDTTAMHKYAGRDSAKVQVGDTGVFTRLKTAFVVPPADSVQALQIFKADGTTSIFNVDSRNSRVGIRTATPRGRLDIGGYATPVTGLTWTPTVYISDSADLISGVSMGNRSSGLAADFRFTISDTSGHYMAFMQPSPNNTIGNLFGFNRATGDFLITNGGTARTLGIGTIQAAGIVFGTTNLERMRILSGGGAAIESTAARGTEKLFVKGNARVSDTVFGTMADWSGDKVRIRTAKTPATAGAAGNAGDVCWDADFVYVCIATNTWKRAAIATWP